MEEGRRKSSVAREAERLQAIKKRRKSSVNQAALDRALAAKVAMIEERELSEEDQKLAEMGYQQVYRIYCFTTSLADAVSGVQAGILLDVLDIFCPLHLRSLRKRRYNLRLPIGRRRCVFCGLVLAYLWMGSMCIALSVSEIVSAYPTSGGMYFTCKYLAPEA
jgi:hypothetical protein